MTEQTPTKIALALGSNVGDRHEALRAAVKALAHDIDITAVSSVYETAPAYVADQPAFLNAALVGTTKTTPLSLLWIAKDIESEIGRQPTYRYGPREIDIDIVFYGDLAMKTPELVIPHVRMTEREFVLRPLAEIAPDWKHPETGQTVAELLARVPETGMTKLGSLI